MHRDSQRQLGIEDRAVDHVPTAGEAVIPEAVRDELLEIDGVQGVGLGGPETVKVYVSVASVQDRVPAQIGDFKVESEVSGEFELL